MVRRCSNRMADFWVGSHPSLVPCDLSLTTDLEAWIHGAMNSSSFAFSLAPRAPIHADWYARSNAHYREHVATNKTARMREKFLLSGLIASWLYMYNETPAASSWIWRWYPDGDEWRQSVDKNGTDNALVGIRQVLSKYVNKRQV